MRTFIMVLLALALAAWGVSSWGSLGIDASTKKIEGGLAAAEMGVQKKDWPATAAGVDTVHWGHKNLYVTHGFEVLGRWAAVIFTAFALCLTILEKKRPNQTPEPTPMAVTPPAAQEPRQP